MMNREIQRVKRRLEQNGSYVNRYIKYKKTAEDISLSGFWLD